MMPLVILSYFFVGPPVAGIVLFAILSLGELQLKDWLSALPPVIGLSFVVGAVPAIVTAVVRFHLSLGDLAQPQRSASGCGVGRCHGHDLGRSPPRDRL